MQGLPALAAVQILGNRVTKKFLALSDGLSLILQRACVIMSITKVKTLHLVLDGHTRSFVCGRSIGPLHRKLQEQPSPAYSRCRLCSRFADSR